MKSKPKKIRADKGLKAARKYLERAKEKDVENRSPALHGPKNVREVKVKGWALCQSDGRIAIAFNHAHNVFQPRVYSTKNSAVKVAETVITGTAQLKVVPCIISFTPPRIK